MKSLMKVVELIADKYINKCDVIVDEGIITVEFKDNVGNIYKTIQVTEFNARLKVKFIPEGTTNIVNFEQLDDIIKKYV